MIYMGFPLRLCDNRMCNTVAGFWRWVVGLIPGVDDGGFAFMRYTGWYPVALWRWLIGGSNGGS